MNWVLGCDARLRNKEGGRARQLAAATGHRATAKACRRAEKTRSRLADHVWAVKLYDFCTERRANLSLLLSAIAHDKAGVVPSAAFVQVAYPFHFVFYPSTCHVTSEATV